MKKALQLLTIISAICLIFYGFNLITEFMVISKYHVTGKDDEQIIYSVRERATEISFLYKYFYLSIFVGLISIVTSIIGLVSKL